MEQNAVTSKSDEQNKMGNYSSAGGKTTIAPEVLLTIARLTTLSVPGVHEMSNVPGGVNRFLNRGLGGGVRLIVKDDVVSADLYVILNQDVNIREVCHNIQFEVSRAVSEMVGMQVGKVNIHVEDIYYSRSDEG
jgi:uncharacterized alkaline shock family protein YloU